MAEMLLAPEAQWIWCGQETRRFNRYVCFRRTLDVHGDAASARLRITADARYEVHVNGRWVGHGPPRSWLSPWTVDEYDLCGLLTPGRNAVAVLVHHPGLSTFQYLHADPGLLAQLDWQDATGEHHIVTDGAWRCAPHPGYAWPAPRIACQQTWEEQFDAREQPPGTGDWREAGFDDGSWPNAAVMRPVGAPPHEELELRDIPLLTRQVIEPARLLAVETVRPAPYSWTVHLRPVINPHDLTANLFCIRVLVATHIYSDRPQPIELHTPHGGAENMWKLNGRGLRFDDTSLQPTDCGVAHARLSAGWNTLLARVPEFQHQPWVVLNAWTRERVRWAARPDEPPRSQGAAASRERPGSDACWLALGPFDGAPIEQHRDWSSPELVTAHAIPADATAERYTTIWERGTLTPDDLRAAFAQPMPADGFPPVDVFALGSSERVVRDRVVRIEEGAALQRDNADWATIYPVEGADARLLLDFGDEVFGYQEFEIDAPAGAILDFHNFEFIQRDGRKNLCEGMNNSFRYVCREGVQRYRTFLRRGFRYTWVSLRQFARPVRIRFIRTVMATYPVTRQAEFACSDALLTRIWEVGAHSVRCCSEDTYTDCPTYEQTHWVGDARNEALVDLLVNGDGRLSRHCWIQTGRSLDRSPLAESHVPSGWHNLLPAWTFLWMRWGLEHYQRTGDRAFAREALGFQERNIAGLRRYINRDGLVEIKAWNMFDWAPMDTPIDGVVTHLSCLAVLGLRAAAELAQLNGARKQAAAWNKLADGLAGAVNRHLWDPRRRAYIDCIRADGTHSPVFSQQTQTAAYISGVATGARARRCREIIEKAPPGFVRAGSAFFMFFALEGMVREGRFERMVDAIRSYWGRQVEAGATTTWETYNEGAARKTRSHCHGWSAAPTYFLSTYVLGIQPLEPGFGTVRIAPQPGGLSWAHGRVPTPRGPVTCYWRLDGKRFELKLWLPPGTPAVVELPVRGKATIVEGKASLTRRGGRVVLTTRRPVLHVIVG